MAPDPGAVLIYTSAASRKHGLKRKSCVTKELRSFFSKIIVILNYQPRGVTSGSDVVMISTDSKLMISSSGLVYSFISIHLHSISNIALSKTPKKAVKRQNRAIIFKFVTIKYRNSQLFVV